MSKPTNEDRDKTDYYKEWEVDRLVDEKIKIALKEYDESLWKSITTQFVIELANIKSWIAVNKFVAVAVALLFIGTLYQLFVGVANSVGLK